MDTLNELLRSGEPGKALMADAADPSGVSWQTPPSPSPDWADVANKPGTFTPTSHGHVIADVTSLQTSLDSKASSSHSHDELPTTGQKNALAGSNGTPGVNNKFVTETDSRLSDARTPSSHTHLIQDVTNLQSSLDGKASSTHNHDAAYAPVSHSHDYAPTSHTHAQSDVTNLTSDLAAKASSSHNHDAAYEAKNANIQTHISSSHAPADAQKNSDITKPEIEAKLTGEITSHTHPAGASTPDATTSSKGIVQLAGDLGGTAASPTVPGLSGKANTSHTHTKSQISDFTHTHVKADVTDFAHTHPASELTATGTRDATTYLRGDNTWVTPAGGGSDSRLVTSRKTSDQAMPAAATDIAGLVITLEANSTYYIYFAIPIGNVTGTSPTITYSLSSAISGLVMAHSKRRQMITATTEAMSVITTVGTFTAGAVISNSVSSIESIIVTGANGGTVQLRSTLGGTSPAVTIKQGASVYAIKTG